MKKKAKNSEYLHIGKREESQTDPILWRACMQFNGKQSRTIM